jgi:hypothetical protein
MAAERMADPRPQAQGRDLLWTLEKVTGHDTAVASLDGDVDAGA